MNPVLTMFRSLVISGAAAALLTVGAAAQQAAFAPFGVACSVPGAPTPAIGARGLPRLGTTFEVTFTGPNHNTSSAQQSAQPVLLTGLNAVPVPAAIPVGTFPQQPAGCWVFVFPDLAIPMPLARSGAAFESALALTVPNDPALIGATWFHQWVSIFRQCGFAGCSIFWAVTSDAAQVLVGT